MSIAWREFRSSMFPPLALRSGSDTGRIRSTDVQLSSVSSQANQRNSRDASRVPRQKKEWPMGEDKTGEGGKGRVDTAMAGFTTATKNMQVIAGEIAKMSME